MSGLLMEIPKGFTQMYEDWPLLRCTLKTHIAILFAWAIERYIAPLSTKPLTVPMVVLQGLNIVIVLLDGDDLLQVCKIRKEAKIASKYPYCIRLKEFYRFIIMPTVCFQVSRKPHTFAQFYYPMTSRINWVTFIKQFLQFIFFLTVVKILADQYIVVAVTNTFTMDEFRSANFSTVACHIIDRMLLLSVPILYCWLLMFVVIFHFWCNLLAEITRFGDRRFYGDWWNASCIGEYWRKWNLPIHQFLIRHISKPLHNLGLPRGLVNIIVFVISAALHEYLISVPLGLGWTGYVFWAMIAQIPLLLITEMDMIKKNKTLGNVLFWCVFCFTGQPLGVLLYWYLWGVKHGSFV
ncbi:acyl transferase [Theileria orientalis strain Shintoku]|uniref:diacylglycerol O-acyltransferase n=1 Tax=Theileria orientalis strain Shintoku TaxID=869250 RepID=J7MEW0_THEOR|nr:acyl transferase [Theileria orientalis strain Shintoku]BAM38769.1 acyl transferase [Theileria orientalis strain Shintoku]|eukprot:XP_009689070.1 acyl transferase [Theileria orientalis strain Shintoku]